MNKLIATFVAFFLVSLSAHAKTQTGSVYTDIKADCITVSNATEKAPIDFFTSECKAFAGFTLKISGGDLRYGPELKFEGAEIDLQRPGRFHDMASQKVEWVYDLTQDEEGSGSLAFKALIYRLSVSDATGDASRDQALLYVVRLNGKKSCVIGTAQTNEAARKLADSKSAACVKVDRLPR